MSRPTTSGVVNLLNESGMIWAAWRDDLEPEGIGLPRPFRRLASRWSNAPVMAQRLSSRFWTWKTVRNEMEHTFMFLTEFRSFGCSARVALSISCAVWSRVGVRLLVTSVVAPFEMASTIEYQIRYLKQVDSGWLTLHKHMLQPCICRFLHILQSLSVGDM